jgi:L-ribulose-5-phosphate 4-epimerase
MLDKLKEEVYQANLDLQRKGMVIYTWGNASGIDRSQNLVVIKPSGVAYEEMKASDMVVVDLEGRVVEGSLNPSSDTPTHLVLYNSFPGIGGIVHTHAPYATIWAQAGKPIPCLGTTHADYFYGSIPVTDKLTPRQIADNYEELTGEAIVKRFKGLDPETMPGVLVASHGVFTWGENSSSAVHNMVVLEEVAKMAWGTLNLNPEAESIPKELLDKHFLRRHGKDKYYGQNQD